MTKKIVVLAVSLIMVMAAVTLAAQDGKPPRDGQRSGTCTFVDENGDGINDNYRDHDGDGIPNHKDPDWKRPRDGGGSKTAGGNRSGRGFGNGKGNGQGRGRLASFRGARNGCGVCNGRGSRRGGRGYRRSK